MLLAGLENGRYGATKSGLFRQIHVPERSEFGRLQHTADMHLNSRTVAALFGSAHL